MAVSFLLQTTFHLNNPCLSSYLKNCHLFGFISFNHLYSDMTVHVSTPSRIISCRNSELFTFMSTPNRSLSSTTAFIRKMKHAKIAASSYHEEMNRLKMPLPGSADRFFLSFHYKQFPPPDMPRRVPGLW